MKKTLLILLFGAMCLNGYSQAITSIHENFDVKCVLAGNFPSGWFHYNAMSFLDSGAWMCSTNLGRPTTTGTPTPGMLCSGVFSGNYHLDTSMLVTPLLNFAGYPDKVYLQFDTKTTNIHLGSILSVLIVPDTAAYSPGTPSVNLDSAIAPIFSNGDSSAWITHEVDLTSYKYSPFYIVFRYTSKSTSGSAWFLDNVNSSTTRLHVVDPVNNDLPIAVNASNGNLTLSCAGQTSGIYGLFITDVLGRVVFKDNINIAGAGKFSLGDLHLTPGVYVLKMYNDHYSGTTKFVIR